MVENDKIDNSGIIVLKSLFKGNDRKITIQPVFSEELNRFLGIPRLNPMEKLNTDLVIDENVKKEIKEGTTFDLTDPVSKATWDWCKHSTLIAGSWEEAQQTPGCQFYVYEEVKEVRKSISKYETLNTALNYIFNCKVESLKDYALLLGIDMSSENPLAIKDYLIKVAGKTPNKIISLFEDENIKIHLLFIKALEDGIIEWDGLHYRFNDIKLGHTKDIAVAYLSKLENSIVLSEIRDTIYPNYAEIKTKASKPKTKK